MPKYESVFIARQDVSTSQVETLTDKFADVIKDNGGEVAKRESWGLRNLAYRMNKNRKGHYVLFNIEAPSDTVLEYERQMRINEDILRYMTIRVDEFDTKPSAILAGDRDKGGRGKRKRDDKKGEK